MLFLLLVFLSSSDAVTLTGSSEYTIPGSEFTLKCDVPEEASQVQLYRRPDLTAIQGSIQVSGGQCHNTTTTTTHVLCSPDVCSCTTTSTLYGTVFQWVIQPQTGDHGSVWYCQRTNARLLGAVVTSPDYTLNVVDGPGTVTLSPSAIYYTKTERDTLPDITCTADCRPGCTFVWTKLDNPIFTASDVLSLGQLDRSEHGTYICTARNVAGELTTRVFVSVMYGPSAAGLSPPATSYTLTERQTISTVTCSSDCNPVCTYRWTKNGQSHTTGSGLHLNNIQRGQTGEYRCTASNEYGSQTSSEVTVIVKFDL
ncbi:hemicentin-1-like [Mizuhopecten yessoensis]|uniref:hemicentin-1-like n=1 Tax=Mizuhopecten yessoensis TaxID=6573 RepID=UPI000B45F446|nr:hemicentin-1-like [Mizuhopecten yessoensis]